MIKPTLNDKFIGALVGTGIGDSLGAFFEGRFEVRLADIEAIAKSVQYRLIGGADLRTGSM